MVINRSQHFHAVIIARMNLPCGHTEKLSCAVSADIVFDVQRFLCFLNRFKMATLGKNCTFMCSCKLHEYHVLIIILGGITTGFFDVKFDCILNRFIDMRICQLIGFLLHDFKNIISHHAIAEIDVFPFQRQDISDSSCHVTSKRKRQIMCPSVPLCKVVEDSFQIVKLVRINLRLLTFLLVGFLFRFRKRINLCACSGFRIG